MRWTVAAIVAAGACLIGASALAAVYAVDDSASVVQGGTTPMRWRADLPGHRTSMAVDGRSTVRLVLNTQPWAGKPGRIYMRLAPHPVRFVLRWSSTGAILPGRIEPGQRVLVYDSTIPAQTLRDVLDVTISADGREFGHPQQLRVSYEIEVAS